jgi:flagellar biosynthesis protein FliQ
LNKGTISHNRKAYESKLALSRLTLSLTFVPKLLVAGGVMVFFGPWMLKKLGQFATQLWTNIPAMF